MGTTNFDVVRADGVNIGGTSVVTRIGTDASGDAVNSLVNIVNAILDVLETDDSD